MTVMLDKTLTIVLAGGRGSRLKPLTDDRAKAAVPFGGKYRIIDFTLTNCLHSGLRRILVLTQYKSHSLQKHLRDGWTVFNPELGEYITPVPPQMRAGESWYVGTADAIYQNRFLIERSRTNWVLILPGDRIYRMDYAAFVESHLEHGGAATVGCMAADREEARNLNAFRVDPGQRIRERLTGPESERALQYPSDELLVSMGIYVFSKEVLLTSLEKDHGAENSTHDFGTDILPGLIAEGSAYAYRFGGPEGRVSRDRYWRNVATLDQYYQANMDLLEPTPPIDIYQQDWAIRTYAAQHPPARTVPGRFGTEGICINSIVAGGVVISGGSVQNSILFPRVRLDDLSVVEDSILFEGVHVGENARLCRCIVDKDVVIPPGASIGYDREQDCSLFPVSEKGVVVVPKGYRFS